MDGTIRCCRCHSGLNEDGDGICPRCKKAKSVYIDLYCNRKHRRLRFGLDWTGTLKKLRKIRSDIDERTFQISDYDASIKSPNLFAARYDEWLESRKTDGLAPATMELYRYHMKGALEHLGDEDVRKIDYDTLDACFKSLKMRGTSKRTVRSVLHAFFVWMRIRKIIKVLPPFPVIRATGAQKKYVLTIEQQEEAIRKLPEHLQDIFRLMTFSGARVSEILTLKLPDINLERGELTINRTWSARKIKENTKTDSPRIFPLYGEAFDIIRRNLKGRVGDVYLFARANGRPYSYSFIQGAWREYSGTGIPIKDATRRSWATNMRHAGAPLDAIRQGLGHSTVKTTEKYLSDDVTWARAEFEKAADVLKFKARDERVTDSGGKK